MTHLPVFATFRNAVKFVLANAFTIVRLTWFPLLVLAVATYFLKQQIITMQLAAIESAPGATLHDALSRAQGAAPLSIVQTIVSLLAISISAVALHRIILFNDRKPGTFILFALGKTEMTYALMAVLWVASIAGFFIAVMLVALSALAPEIGNAGDIVARFMDGTIDASVIRAGGLFAVIMGVAGFLAVWAMVRLSVLPAAVVATGRLAVSETLALTRGNAWNLIGLFFVTMFSLLVVLMIVGSLLLPPAIKDMWLPLLRETAFDPGRMMQTALHWQLDHLAMLTALEYCVMILATALGVGLISHAYKALKGVPADQALPAPG